MEMDVAAKVRKHAGGKALQDYERGLFMELYPAAFTDEFNWLREGALERHGTYAQEHVTKTPEEI